jgi:carbon monoxide dehydrogenase subunit G
MELQNERHLPWPRERVWNALNDPGFLQLCIPGCESMEASADNQYDAQVQAKVGPVKARFRGQVSVNDLIPLESYTLRFESQGGAAGFARGEADVHLADADGGGSILRYSARATVGGKLAQIGSRLVQATARKMADEFFDNFTAQLEAGDGAVETVPQLDPSSTSNKSGWKFWSKAKQGME